MRLSAAAPVHLTYCLNVFPGISFADQCAAARGWNRPERPLGLGLWLGDTAAREAEEGGAAAAWSDWCREQGRYVFTLNGFPFGRFHGAPVKASVYRPDWTSPARRDHTVRLARLLARWLPADVPGSISTVPIGYAPDYGGPEARAQAFAMAIPQLVETAWAFERLAEETGCDLCLALEPEPWCLLEKCGDVLEFFTRHLWPRAGSENEAVVRRRIGVCVDTCHCALVFEEPEVVIRACRDAGIRIGKIQLSAALSAPSASPADRARLEPFAEPVYFHQAAQYAGGRIRRWPDLPEALADETIDPRGALRVHMHVPLHWEGDGPLQSTRGNMSPSFWRLLAEGVCPNLEVETYTYQVLPRTVAGTDLYAAISREIDWVLAQWPGATTVL